MENMIKEMETKIEDLLLIKNMVDAKDERVSKMSPKVNIMSGAIEPEVKNAKSYIDAYNRAVAKGKTSGIMFKQTEKMVKSSHKTIVKRWDKMAQYLNFDEIRGTEVLSMADTVDNTIRCPKCGSTNLYTDKKGFGIGKAVVGTAVTGLVGGVLLGSMGRKKLEHTCINCNHRFKNK